MTDTTEGSGGVPEQAPARLGGSPGSDDGGDPPGYACGAPSSLLYQRIPGGANPDGTRDAVATGSDDDAVVRPADDFEVPDRCWCIDRVVFVGEAVDTTLTGEIEVGIYEDADGRPAPTALVEELGDFSTGPADLAYSFRDPVILDKGRYWLSPLVFVEQMFPGQWQWWGSDYRSRHDWVVTSNDPEQPDCSEWASSSECLDAAPTDRAMLIFGTIGGVHCQ